MLIGDENEQSNSGALDTGNSPEPQDQTVTGAEGGEGQESPQLDAKQKQESTTPFHEHPRFKELIEGKNKLQEEVQAYKQQMAELQRQMQEVTKPKDNKPDFESVRQKMRERLPGIDPEYATYMQMLEEQALGWKEELAKMQRAQFETQAVSTVKELHTKNSVSPELQEIYDQNLNVLYAQGQIKSIEDVQKAYSAVHEKFSKILDGARRAERESYASQKKETSAKPSSQPKGKAPAQGVKDQKFATPEEAKANLVKRAVELWKADNNI